MKKSRFTEERIIRVLKEAETGVKVADLCCQHGISDVTLSRCARNTAVWMILRRDDCSNWRTRTGG